MALTDGILEVLPGTRRTSPVSWLMPTLFLPMIWRAIV